MELCFSGFSPEAILTEMLSGNGLINAAKLR